MNFAYYYIEANIICIIIALILIIRTLRNIDKQLRQIEFVKSVSLFVVLFLFDILWMLFESQILKGSIIIIHSIYFMLFSTLACCAYQWFIYSEVVQGNSKICKTSRRFLYFLPILILILVFLFYTVLIIISSNQKHLEIYRMAVHKIMIFIAFCYGILTSIKTFYRAGLKENYLNKGLYILMGLYPLILTFSVLMQILFLHVPIMCFLSMFVMLCYYFNGMDKLISIDPLTKLNNRNQLKRYFHQLKSVDENKYYLLIIDVDNFKLINDVYGHLEGDNALKIVADTFTQAVREYKFKTFISRYGGDEFVIIALGEHRKDAEDLKKEITKKLFVNSVKAKTDYELTVSIGISKIKEKYDTLEQCIEKADKELYLEKFNKKNKKKKNNK